MERIRQRKRQGRPCAICRRWFTPNPKVGYRQKTCGQPSCKAEQKRRTQAAWSKKNPSYWTERRLEKQLQQDLLQTLDGIRKTDSQPGYAQIPLIQMQEAIGKEILVIVLFLVRILLRMHQDALSKKALEIKGEMDRIRSCQAQEAKAKARDGP